MEIEKRFGYEWHKYHQIDPNYERQFLSWIGSLQPQDFRNKKVLDAGCGMGRNSYWVLKYGAQQVTAFDLGRKSVDAAKKNLAGFQNVEIELKSIYEINWKNAFDIAFSIGVIHHLSQPELAVRNLARAIKPGGLLLIWVYGYENNEWIVKWVNPIRIYFTSKLPVGLLHFLTYFLSAPLWLYLKIFKPQAVYLNQLSSFGFSHLHSIVFDQLLPAIANYYKKEEAYQLLVQAGLKNIVVKPTNQNSWTVIGHKPPLP